MKRLWAWRVVFVLVMSCTWNALLTMGELYV